MRKHLRIAACSAALMLTLTGCGFSAQNKAFFRYCFGDDYTFTAQGVVEASGHTAAYRSFRLTYTDVNGSLRVNDDVRSYLNSEKDKDLYPTKRDYYNALAEEIAVEEMSDIAKEEFREKLLSQYFDCVPSEKESSYNDFYSDLEDGSGSVLLLFSMPVYLPNDREPDLSIALEHIAPGTGLQACKADLKSVAQDDQWMMSCTLRLEAGADGEQYAQKMEQMMNAYVTYTEAPCNYAFVVTQKPEEDDQKNKILYHAYSVMGEPVDIAAKRAEKEDYSVGRDIYDRIIEKYGNTK